MFIYIYKVHEKLKKKKKKKKKKKTLNLLFY